MKNKYLALALGMALTMTACPVMASVNTNTTTTESSTESSTPPEKPDGEKPDGKAPGEPLQDGNGPEGQGAPGEGGPGEGGPGEQTQGIDSYDAVNDCTEDTTFDGENIESSGTDENAVLVENGADVSIKDSDILRSSSDSTGGDNSSFYGVGAAVLATDGTASVSGGTISTDAKGGAGLFAYGDGTVYASLQSRILPVAFMRQEEALCMHGI